MNHYPDADGQLDAEAEALLDEIVRSGSPPTASLTPQQVRASFIPPELRGASAPLAEVRDVFIPGPAGRLGLRLYRPAGASPLPVFAFFHGGGFVAGTLAEFDGFCSRLAGRAGCIVVSVDYRLAPEHPHPAAVDDAWAALAWIASHAEDLGGDPGRLAIGGDSAGGNLAAVTAIAARDAGGPRVLLQVLLCPWVDLSCDETESFRLFGRGPWLSTQSIAWYRRHYLGASGRASDPRVSPLLAADLSGLPPAFVVNAEFDVLRDQAQAYARRLQEAGGAVDCRLYAGVLHDFAVLPGAFTRASAAIDDVAAALRRSLG